MISLAKKTGNVKRILIHATIMHYKENLVKNEKYINYWRSRIYW